jgi:tetratricopeptide (TPR) repeat protein
VDDALAEFREAIRLQPDHAAAHSEVGAILCDFKHDYDAAISEFRTAIRLEPDDPDPHYGLGNALSHRGKLEEALAQYREVLRLKPGNAEVRETLGMTLAHLAKHQQAVAEYREAIRLQPDRTSAHYHLARSLQSVRQEDGAMAEYLLAIRLAPDFAEAHCNLAELLRRHGRYAESLDEYKRGHELGSKRADWPYPSGRWVEEVRRLVWLRAKLPALLRGEAEPADAIERLGLAEVAHTQGWQATAAHVLGEALEAQPKLADDIEGAHRYNAARFAALAGCGRGKDQPPPDEAARTGFRRQALEWLKADVAAWSKIMANAASKNRSRAPHLLEHARHDPDLAGVRDPPDMNNLPEAEQADWRALWSLVDTILAQSRADSPAE